MIWLCLRGALMYAFMLGSFAFWMWLLVLEAAGAARWVTNLVQWNAGLIVGACWGAHRWRKRP